MELKHTYTTHVEQSIKGGLIILCSEKQNVYRITTQAANILQSVHYKRLMIWTNIVHQPNNIGE